MKMQLVAVLMVGFSSSCARVLPRINYTATGVENAAHDADMD